MEKINEKYYLGSNKHSYILYEKKISASGKETYKNAGYFSSLASLYESIIEKDIKEDLTILNNIKVVKDMVENLKEFTLKYLEK